MSVRWGVIGACGIADRRTIPEGLAASPECELIGVMDVKADATAAVAAKYGVPHAVTRVEDLLDLPGLQAVYIASPVHLHLEQITAAAERGKHVLCEKPMCLNVDQAEAAVRTCEQRGVLLGVGYMMRFHHLHRALQEMAQRGDLGQLVFGRAQGAFWYPELPGAWRQVPKLGGGGALPDVGCHCIDLLEQILGPVVAVQAYVDTLTFTYGVDDTATLLLKHRDGAHGVVDARFNTPAAPGALEIYGTKGSAIARGTIGQGGGEMTAYLPEAPACDAALRRDDRGGFAVEAEPVNIYREEVERFSRAILSGEAPPVPGSAAVRVHRVMAAAVRSARGGGEAAA